MVITSNFIACQMEWVHGDGQENDMVVTWTLLVMVWQYGYDMEKIRSFHVKNIMDSIHEYHMDIIGVGLAI